MTQKTTGSLLSASALLLGACTSMTQKNTENLLVKTSYLKEIQPFAKEYKKGDSGENVQKIEEWLMIWQLNQNYISDVLHINVNQKFDDQTEKVVKNVQTFLGLEPTGIVDNKTWLAMVSPMQEAFHLQSYNHKTLRKKMRYYATKHLQFRAAELEEDNMGPWVRAYMDGEEGEYYYWCAGFASTILDQTFSSIGEHFNEYYARSWLVEDYRVRARSKDLLVTHDQLTAKTYTPQIGDMVIFISDHDGHAHHIEIVYEILDPAKGDMLTIGGNTNFSGSRNGVGVFMVDRNFMDDDVEIIKLIDKKTIRNHQNIPEYARKLLRSYPHQISDFRDNKLIFSDKSTLVYDAFGKQTLENMLVNADVKDQAYFPYKAGLMTQDPSPYQDPGRITSQDFFKKIYGDSQKEVEENLVEFTWAPNFGGQKVKATKINGVATKLKQIGEELDDDPTLEPFLTNIGGTYKWRKVAGTNRLSLHSFGIAIDLNVSQSSYWQWDCKCTDEKTILKPHKNRIPQKIIDVFEKHGFIWGGKWYHYDTMHFEYRPDLLNG